MSKTKEISIKCSGQTRIDAHRNLLLVVIEDPDVDDALTSFNSNDIISYIQANYGVDEVFEQKELEKWAEENGYVKQ